MVFGEEMDGNPRRKLSCNKNQKSNLEKAKKGRARLIKVLERKGEG